MSKHCNKCNRDLPLSEFHKDKNNKDGLNRWCMDCKKTARFINCEIPEVYLKRRWDGFAQRHHRRDRNITYEELLNVFKEHCEENISEGKHMYACAYTGEVMTFFQGKGRIYKVIYLLIGLIMINHILKKILLFVPLILIMKKGQLTLELIKKILKVFKKKGIDKELYEENKTK
jgi:hypothetical protein